LPVQYSYDLAYISAVSLAHGCARQRGSAKSCLVKFGSSSSFIQIWVTGGSGGYLVLASLFLKRGSLFDVCRCAPKILSVFSRTSVTLVLHVAHLNPYNIQPFFFFTSPSCPAFASASRLPGSVRRCVSPLCPCLVPLARSHPAAPPCSLVLPGNVCIDARRAMCLLENGGHFQYTA
jgi:hypothetical protein